MYKVQLFQDGRCMREIRDPQALTAVEALEYAEEQNDIELELHNIDPAYNDDPRPSCYVDYDEVRIIYCGTEQQRRDEEARRVALMEASNVS
jgi:hypothetical protein